MPKLQDTRKLIDVTLPSNPEVKITLRDGLLAGDLEDIERIDNNFLRSLTAVQKMIQSWNFEEDDGSITPVTVENIKKLNTQDIDHILKATSFVNDFLVQQTGQAIKK